MKSKQQQKSMFFCKLFTSELQMWFRFIKRF